MKAIILIHVLLTSLAGLAQSSSIDKPERRESSGRTHQLAASVDSFNICGFRFSTLRDCAEGSWRNCCSFYTEPTYVTCTDIGSLSWHNMRSLEIAEMNMKQHIADLRKENKIISIDTIACNVLGYQAKAYHLKRSNSDGTKYSDIRMGAVVNGQPILLELRLFNTISTNQQIPPVFRQIVTIGN